MKKTAFTSHCIFSLLLLLLALEIGCAAKKNTANNTPNIENASKLIFLNYRISKDENEQKHIEFTGKTIVDGKLKNASNQYLKIGVMGDLKCCQLNNDSIEIHTVIIKNPLNKPIEYINDSLIFETKTKELQKASFSLRLQLHPETKYMAIKEITDSLQNYKILIINKIN